ncbi:MAG: hypothetical protein ACK40G_06810 [Cytophagaceae bacterium]
MGVKFLIGIFFLMTSLSMAAQNKDTLTPNKGNKQVLVGVVNTSSLLALRINKSKDLAYRLDFGGFYNIDKSPEYDGNYVRSSWNSDRYSLVISAGVQKNLWQSHRAELYCGLDAMMSLRGYKTYSKDFTKMDSVTIERKNNYRNDYRLSILPFAGFNYYLTDWIALGVEYKMSPFSLELDRGSILEEKSTDANGQVIYHKKNDLTKNGVILTGWVGSFTSVRLLFLINKRKS